MKKKEAMKILKDFHDKSALFSVRTALDTVLPELAESGDESIRKSIIGFLTTIASLKDGKTVSNEDFDSKAILDWVAWLEKQGEQKFEQKFFINDKVVHKATGKIWTIHYYLKDTNSYYVEDNDGLLHHYRESELKLVEQKPTEWSEEDEAIYYGVIETEQYMLDVVNGIKKFDVGNASIKEECTRELNWLNSLKGRILPQPKQEWSEQDERIRQDIENLIHFALEDGSAVSPAAHTTKEEAISWIQFLKDRHTWKPSDEQMDALETAVSSLQSTALESLYQKLNKLM